MNEGYPDHSAHKTKNKKKKRLRGNGTTPVQERTILGDITPPRGFSDRGESMGESMVRSMGLSCETPIEPPLARLPPDWVSFG